jgi:hypothetical protein
VSEPTKVFHYGVQDEALRDALVADAEERGASINDLAVGILAERFEIEFEGSGRKSPGVRGGRVGAYRMPLSLWHAIGVEALTQQTTMKAIVAEVLGTHYGLSVPVAS